MRLIICLLMLLGVTVALGMGSAAAQPGQREVTEGARGPDVQPEKELDVNPKAGFDAEAARTRDKGKKVGGAGECVVPRPTKERIKAVLDYVKAALAGARAPEDLDIRLAFEKNRVLLNLVREGKSPAEGENKMFRFHWILPTGCKGNVVWQSTVAPDAPAWVRAIHTQGFAAGLPIHPKSVSAFRGDPYGRGGVGPREAHRGGDGTGNPIWLAGVLVGMGCVVLRRFL